MRKAAFDTPVAILLRCAGALLHGLNMNRWVVLVAGVVLQTILGGVYAWSAFTPSLISDYGLTNGQCGLIFGVTIAVFTLTMVAAGMFAGTFAGLLTVGNLKPVLLGVGLEAKLATLGISIFAIGNGISRQAGSTTSHRAWQLTLVCERPVPINKLKIDNAAAL